MSPDMARILTILFQVLTTSQLKLACSVSTMLSLCEFEIRQNFQCIAGSPSICQELHEADTVGCLPNNHSQFLKKFILLR